jgi:hypothetical protein
MQWKILQDKTIIWHAAERPKEAPVSLIKKDYGLK